MPTPFLTYLTVFRSRLGLANLLISLTGFTHQPVEALQRRLRQVVEKRDELRLGDTVNDGIFSYLVDKTLISSTVRKSGRYQGYSLSKAKGTWACQSARGGCLDALPVYLVDKWMSDPRLRSTVGAPTPDNAGEIVEFGYQLRLVTRSKNTWTAAGHLASALRESTTWSEAESTNPFLLGLEMPALLRQIVDTDGLMLREVLREVIDLQPKFTRDELAGRFGRVVDRAVAAARARRVNPADFRKIRDFATQVHKTLSRRGKMSKGPGLLEHRVSPRLEWLTDLGYLSKAGLANNGFEYRVEPAALGLIESLDDLGGSDRWGAEVAIGEWCRNPAWSELRSTFAIDLGAGRFLDAYRMLRRKIGPVPLQEMVFVSSMRSDSFCDFAQTFEEVLEFARTTEGVNLAGGRYRRSPENIFIADAVLEQ